MSYLYNELTTEQKCAVIGFAIDFCGCGNPTPKQFSQIENILADMGTELEVPKARVESFVNKMQNNGRITYAIDVIKTIENKRMLGSFYPYFYSIVAILHSTSGLNKLNQIYDNEFGYGKDDIDLIWDLYEIKDFRKSKPYGISTPSTPSMPKKTGGQGCFVLAIAISTSLLACLIGIINIAI